MNCSLKKILIENPVIAAVRDDMNLEKALKSKASIVFVLYGNIMNIKDICSKLIQNNKTVFVHIDMIEGLKGDCAGTQFIKNTINPSGIISTKSSNIKYANQLGMCTIQRIFIIDSYSLKTGIKNIKETEPNAVEVMPGVANKIISKIEQNVQIPIIAGGLIDSKKDAMESLAAGAFAISTTCSRLWNL